jgi:hypothetical protein
MPAGEQAETDGSLGTIFYFPADFCRACGKRGLKLTKFKRQ